MSEPWQEITGDQVFEWLDNGYQVETRLGDRMWYQVGCPGADTLCCYTETGHWRGVVYHKGRKWRARK